MSRNKQYESPTAKSSEAKPSGRFLSEPGLLSAVLRASVSRKLRKKLPIHPANRSNLHGKKRGNKK